MKIFIADSSELIRDRLTSLLTTYKDMEIVGTGIDSAETLSAITETLPDVVVMDFLTPELQRAEIIRDVKGKHQNLKFIVFTQYPYPQFRQQCFDAGADFFFDKATDFKELIETILDFSCQNFLSNVGPDGTQNSSNFHNGGAEEK
jgi:DNA-binding NarL/FixJ family response regulator